MPKKPEYIPSSDAVTGELTPPDGAPRKPEDIPFDMLRAIEEAAAKFASADVPADAYQPEKPLPLHDDCHVYTLVRTKHEGGKPLIYTDMDWTDSNGERSMIRYMNTEHLYNALKSLWTSTFPAYGVAGAMVREYNLTAEQRIAFLITMLIEIHKRYIVGDLHLNVNQHSVALEIDKTLSEFTTRENDNE